MTLAFTPWRGGLAAAAVAGLLVWGLLAPSSLLLACGVLAALSSFAILFEKGDPRARRKRLG